MIIDSVKRKIERATPFLISLIEADATVEPFFLLGDPFSKSELITYTYIYIIPFIIEKLGGIGPEGEGGGGDLFDVLRVPVAYL